MRTAVVLPAPFGPRSPSTVPSGTARSTPQRASTLPYDLRSPSASMARPLPGRAVPGEVAVVPVVVSATNPLLLDPDSGRGS